MRIQPLKFGLYLIPILLLIGLLGFGGEAMAFRIESPSFQDQGNIPQKHTCDGQDLSPPLSWSSPPEGTKSFALISEDPDATVGTWVHWVVYDLPSENLELKEGVPPDETLQSGAKQGTTDFKQVGYGGPCPPPGKPHRYIFKLYALDTPLDLPPKASKTDLLVAMNGHVLAQADLVGLYERS